VWKLEKVGTQKSGIKGSPAQIDGRRGKNWCWDERGLKALRVEVFRQPLRRKSFARKIEKDEEMERKGYAKSVDHQPNVDGFQPNYV